MPKTSIFTLIVFVPTLLLKTYYTIGAEEDEKTEALTSGETQSSKEPNWTFSIDFNSKNSTAEQIHYIQISDSTIPVLHYWANGRKERGTVVFLTAQEESPSSNRLAYPLSIQLSQLGWEVLAPALPKADFKGENGIENANQAAEAESAKQASESSTTNTESGENKEKKESATENDLATRFFFDSASQYQDWIDQTIGESLKLKKSNNSTIVLIANQNSAYWILDSTPKFSNITQIVLISPQIPGNVSSEIKEKIQLQNLPLYVFSQNGDPKNIFNRVIEQNFWNAPNIRINRQLTPNRQLDIENPIIARKISGWIDSQNRSNN